MLEWWSWECLLEAALPPVSACPLPLRESRDVQMFFYTLSICFKKKDRCQNSVLCARQTCRQQPYLPSSLLGREFNEKPITCLSWSTPLVSASHKPVYFNGVHKDPISFFLSALVPFLFCTVRVVQKHCGATHLTVCLQTFYITVSALVKDERERVTERGFTICAPVSLIHSFL